MKYFGLRVAFVCVLWGSGMIVRGQENARRTPTPSMPHASEEVSPQQLAQFAATYMYRQQHQTLPFYYTPDTHTIFPWQLIGAQIGQNPIETLRMLQHRPLSKGVAIYLGVKAARSYFKTRERLHRFFTVHAQEHNNQKDSDAKKEKP